MTTFEVIIIIVTFSLVDLSNHVQITDTTDIFLQVDEKIMAAIEDLFIYLKLNRDFTKSKTVQGYMSMPKFIQSALRKNHKRYKEIQDVIKLNINNKTAERNQIINEVIDELIREQAVKYNKSTHKKKNHTSAKIKTVEDFIDLARVFHLNVNTLTPNDFYVDSSNKSSQESKSRRIFAGRSTSIDRYPFMVSVHVAGRFVCAGSLVHESLALSAASCLIHTNEDAFVQIRFGSDYSTKMGVLVQIIALTYHPEFNRTTLANNLVLLTTSKIIKLKPGKVIIIKYDRWNPRLNDVDDVVIVGWGHRSDKEKNIEDRPLAEARLDIYDLEECKYIYTSDYVTNKAFCAGFVDRGDGACNHDGGGPAVADGVLVGVVSFGSPSCGRADAPTVFTRLALYYDWIDSVLNSFDAANPPKLEIPDSNEIPDAEINVEESDADPRDVLKQEFGIEDILHGPIDMAGGKLEASTKINQQGPSAKRYIKNMTDLHEADLQRMYQQDQLNLSTDEDLLAVEPFQVNEESTPNSRGNSIPDPTTAPKASEFTYLMKQHSWYITKKIKDTASQTAKRNNEEDRDDYYDYSIMTPSIKVTSFHKQVATPIANKIEPILGPNDKSIEVSGSFKISQFENRNIEPNLSVGEYNKAIIILSDSGTTQRFEMHKRDPLYEKGIKAWVKSINS